MKPISSNRSMAIDSVDCSVICLVRLATSIKKHRHAKRARVIFLVMGVFEELFTVMIQLSFFGLRCTARRKLEIYNL